MSTAPKVVDPFIIALIIIVFIGSYVIISSEKVHRTLVALGGGSLTMILLVVPGILTYEDVILELVSWKTIMFIITMMVIVNLAARSGLFQFIALYLVKLTRGEIKLMYISFFLLTCAISPFFDTITTMLILGPLTIEIARVLEFDPRPFLISEALAANYVSSATLVGSIPNIIIADVAELQFLDFILYIGPLVILLVVVSLPVLLFLNRYRLQPIEVVAAIFTIDPQVVITNQKLFYFSIGAIILIIIGFTLSPFIGLEPALIAFIIAAALLAFSGEDPEDVFNDVDWSSVFFIIGLFLIVEGLSVVGVIDVIAEMIKPILEIHPALAIVIILFFSAISSSVVDNIPIATALAPLLVTVNLGRYLFWPLIVGVNVGGIVLPISSPANVLAVSMAEKEHKPITFMDFFRVGALLAFLLLVISFFYFVLIFVILGISG